MAEWWEINKWNWQQLVVRVKAALGGRDSQGCVESCQETRVLGSWGYSTSQITCFVRKFTLLMILFPQAEYPICSNWLFCCCCCHCCCKWAVFASAQVITFISTYVGRWQKACWLMLRTCCIARSLGAQVFIFQSKKLWIVALFPHGSKNPHQ